MNTRCCVWLLAAIGWSCLDRPLWAADLNERNETAAATDAGRPDAGRAGADADGLAGAQAARLASARLAALESITAEDIQRHVEALADDTFEGREAGSRGGRAAAGYLGREYQKNKLAGGGTGGGYYQVFGPQYRNLLGLLPGSDPLLADEVIVVGAHYDHVGYGNATNSYGPVGYIHNGADDNASGTAGLLEVVEALASMESRPKRSILFALWDGEEKGLLGSRHWVNEPTLALERVTIMLNMDMIGRLRNDRLEVYGIRSSRGLRRMVSLANRDSNLVLDFQWDMREDSDHFSFYDRGLPVLMLHTGLHEDYHRPGDDAEKINLAGAERVGRLLFNMLIDLADRPDISGFRQASHSESAAARRALERPLPPLPGRLGITWDLKMDAEGRGLWVTRVAAGSPAALGGIRPGDRIVRFDGRPVDRGAALRAMALAAESPVEVSLVRAPASEPIELSLQLRGDPVRLGLSWRADDAEPGSVLLTRVVPDSPAARAGLRVQDRIYQVSGQSVASSDELARLLLESGGPVELAVERQGRVSSVLLPPSGFAGE